METDRELGPATDDEGDRDARFSQRIGYGVRRRADQIADAPALNARCRWPDRQLVMYGNHNTTVEADCWRKSK